LRHALTLLTCAVLYLLPGTADAAGGEPGGRAAELIKLAGIKAGVCVHLGVTDGRFTAELSAGGKFLVHGLAADGATAEKARKHIQSKGLYGEVSVEIGFFEQLPYAENLINLVIIEDLAALRGKGLKLKEVFRVITPNGAICIKGGSREELTAAGFTDVKAARGWLVGTKPRPAGMDEWTHAWHGPDNNLVSGDTLVKPSSQLQWLAGPLFGHHRGPIGAVTAGGRLFYVLYDNPLGVVLPARVFLAARDAYNGKLLWKRPLPNTTLLSWGHAPFFKPGTLVAAGDLVFAVLKPGAPLSALDAATGKVLREYDALPSPDCVVHYKKTLILGSSSGLHAAEVESGKLLWKSPARLARPTTNWQRMQCVWKGGPLAVTEEKIFFLEGENLTCLDVKTGKQVWRTNAAAQLSRGKGALVMGACYRGVLVLRGRGGVHAFRTTDGKYLWSQSGSRGYGLGGLLWVWFSDKNTKRRGWHGLDLKTGEEKRTVELTRKLPAHIKGKRILDGQCNHPLATENYFIATTRTSLIDTRTGKFHNTMITRASCRFLLALPANGLLYSFPKDCNCYPCLRGMLAYAPAPKAVRGPRDADRLVKGPAFGKASAPGPAKLNGADWPTHRADGQRSGSTPGIVSVELKELWTANVGGKLSAPTIAAGKVFVSSIDQHRVQALNLKDGKPAWSFTAGGRVDSPPTILNGLCIFGSRNGWVYCLRAGDGQLVWRFLAAPEDRRIGGFNQLESPWPVHGAVLARKGKVYFSAGRHANAEGGIKVYGMDPDSGKVLWKNGPSYEILNDVLRLGQAGKIYLGHYKVAYDPVTGKPAKDTPRLRTTWAGLLNGQAGGGWRGKNSGIDLTVFDEKRTVAVYSAPLTKKKKRGANIPGRGYKITMKSDGPKWQLRGVPVRVNAMVLTRDKVLAAGPLDFPSDPKSEKPWAVLDGDKGGKLLVLSATDGKKLSELKLDFVPVFDGMSVAGGKIFISGRDGKLRCYGK
jgi:outer membrane protein assembly factor BamB